MHHIFKTSGVCSKAIEFDIDDQGCLHNVCFHGGCPGNTAGIAKLAEGQPALNLAGILEGTDCRGRGTSCPDQFAKAIHEALQTLHEAAE